MASRRAGGMFVVSGVAGSGKSALVGMLLATSDDAVTEALANIGYGRVPDDLRPAGVVVRRSDSSSAAAPSPTPSRRFGSAQSSTPERISTRSLTRAVREGRRLTVLVDALDESRDPLTIASPYGDSLRCRCSRPGRNSPVDARRPRSSDPRDSAIWTRSRGDASSTATRP